MASLSSVTCTPPRLDRQHQTSQGASRSRAPSPSCPPGPSTPSGASGSSGAPSQSSAAPVHLLSGILNQILYELSLLKGENAKQSASLAKLRSQQSKLQSTLDELVLKSFSIEKSSFKVHVYILHASIQACHNACICFITCNRIPCLRLLGLFFAIVHAENPPLLRYQ